MSAGTGTGGATDVGRWFDEARFGMFIHWGHPSRVGRELSWPMTDGATRLLPYAHEVSVDEYHREALDFCPRPGAAAEWAAVARRAGMRYAVFTTRHHDGFAMFRTEHTDFGIAQTSYDGDLVREFVDAFRAEGLRVGLYHSLSDWHHPDYPAFREEDKPYWAWMLRRETDPAAWDRYLDCLFAQVRQLLTAYGPIDVLWFDGQWERSPDQWRTTELAAMIRELQPGILINDRLTGEGDFATPEQSVPPEAPGGRWETCMTMNRTWGWHPGDTEYKSSRDLVHTLCETAGRGGNLLLNVSPMGDGRLPQAQLDRLTDVARWMDVHGAAIHGTQAGLAPWQLYGPSTVKGSRTFLHLVMRPYDTVSVRGVPVARCSVRHLATGTPLDIEPRLTAEAMLLGDPIGELRIHVPDALLDPLATVLELTIAPA